MPREYLKKAKLTAKSDASETKKIVRGILDDIEAGGDQAKVLLQAGVIWLVRSLYFHSSLWGAALDFGLVSLGLASAAWAMSNTGSLVAAIWSFFLVQAMFCWLPGFTSASPRDDYAAATSSQFDTAHRAAEAAVRHLLAADAGVVEKLTSV